MCSGRAAVLGRNRVPGTGCGPVQVWMGSDRFPGRFRRFWEVDLPKLPVPEVRKVAWFRVSTGSGRFQGFPEIPFPRLGKISAVSKVSEVPMGSNRFRSSGDSVGEVRKVAAVSKISLVPAFEGHKSSA